MRKSESETVALYGSDWPKLTREPNWPSCARELLKAIQEVIPSSVEKIFSGNAKKLFRVEVKAHLGMVCIERR